jgi:hypothetical protein
MGIETALASETLAAERRKAQTYRLWMDAYIEGGDSHDVTKRIAVMRLCVDYGREVIAAAKAGRESRKADVSLQVADALWGLEVLWEDVRAI